MSVNCSGAICMDAPPLGDTTHAEVCEPTLQQRMRLMSAFADLLML